LGTSFGRLPLLMQIYSYKRPTTPRISCEHFSVALSPYPGARDAGWDDVDPAGADYMMVPFTFKAFGPALDGRLYLGGDISLPFTSASDLPGQYQGRRRLREDIVRAFLSAFPHFERYPEKHILIDNGDADRPCPFLRDAILFKTNPSYRYPDVLPMPLPVADPGPPRPITEADIDVSFQGYLDQHPIRHALAWWTRQTTNLRVEFRATNKPLYAVANQERADMVRENFELMLRSRFVLSPRGRGTTSRRFFEILAHGRIPILVSDSAKLPLESVIDYDKFVIRMPEGFVALTEEFVREFEAEHDIVEASELARSTYVEYFAPYSFRRFIEASLATRAR